MHKVIHWSVILLLLLGFVLSTGCEKDDPLPNPPEEEEPEEEEEDPDEEPEDIPQASDVNLFIWEGLATYYYWVDDVPDLIDPVFNNPDSLNRFLNQYNDSEELFYSLLYEYEEVDRWSFVVDDYSIIENWTSGVDKSVGFDFMLSYKSPVSDYLFGYVRYVMEGSPADEAGIERGDFFLEVDGQPLTLSNYQSLLFSDDPYTLHMADWEGGNTFTKNGVTHDLTPEVIRENPVHMDTVLTVDGYKVGYLVYNGFTSAYNQDLETSYDLLLNAVFADFQSSGIDQLVIDLRYNGGGSIQTAKYLASMIHSTDNTKVLAETQYNDLLQNYFRQEEGEEYFYDYFTDHINAATWQVKDDEGNVTGEVETPETPINSLNLNELYVITSYQTASASELLINGLEPYMDDVWVIGENTAGKNVGSFTIRDYDNKGNLNPNHDWAMQPITLKIANSEGYSDYINGLAPDQDMEAVEIYSGHLNLLPFGDPEEELLKIALNHIRGVSTKSGIRNTARIRNVDIPKRHAPFSQEMYAEPERIFRDQMPEER